MTSNTHTNASEMDRLRAVFAMVERNEAEAKAIDELKRLTGGQRLLDVAAVLRVQRDEAVKALKVIADATAWKHGAAAEFQQIAREAIAEVTQSSTIFNSTAPAWHAAIARCAKEQS